MPPLLARLVLLLAGLGLLLAAACPLAEAGERRTSAGHRVRWDDGLGGTGERVLERLPGIVRQVEERLGFPFPGGPAEIVVVSGLARMRAEAGVHVPAWAAGVCVGSRSRIVLRADQLSMDSAVRGFGSTLRHEWVHLAWSRRARAFTRRLPLWLEEGLAEEIGGGISVDGGAKLDFAAAMGRLIPLEQIEAHWPDDGDRAALAYRQGRSWVTYFVSKKGWDALRLILRDLAAGKGKSDSPAAGTPFGELVYAHTGTTISDWNASWRLYLEETADPLFFLLWRDFTGTILFVIAVIAGLSFFFLRRTRRRQMDELPDDPMPEGLPAGDDGV